MAEIAEDKRVTDDPIIQIRAGIPASTHKVILRHQAALEKDGDRVTFEQALIDFINKHK